MYHPPSKRVRFVRKFAVLGVMMIFVVVTAAILAALTLGYSFSPEDGGHIQRGGIMQLGSQPSGATVSINGTKFGSTTPTKLTSQAGEYSIEMTRSGYRTWQKNVPINTGGISWITYPRLIPTKLTPEAVETYSGTVSSALPSGESRFYAVLETADNPTVAISRLDSDKVKTTTVELPSALYTDPTEAHPRSEFSIVRWTGDEKGLLLSHTYGEGSVEWILFNLDNPEKSVNITKHIGIAGKMTKPAFSVDDGTELYALIDGDVRIIDLDRQTLSRPIVSDARDFSLYGNGFVLYTQQNEDGTQSVGYVKKDYKEPRLVKTLQYEGTVSPQLKIGKYFDKYYFLITEGNKATLSSSSSLPDDNSSELTLTHEKTFELDAPIIKADISDNGQLATVQDGANFATYNLELERVSSTKIMNTQAPKAQTLSHLDRYLFWGVNDGMLRTYEFDGENQHDIMPMEYEYGATLSPNNRYLYAVSTSEDGEKTSLTRVRMILPR